MVNSFLGRYTLETGARFIAWWNIVLSIIMMIFLAIGIIVLIAECRNDCFYRIPFPVIKVLGFSVSLFAIAFHSWACNAGIRARDHNLIKPLMELTSVFIGGGIIVGVVLWFFSSWWFGFFAGVFGIVNVYFYVVLKSLCKIFKSDLKRQQLESDVLIQVPVVLVNV